MEDKPSFTDILSRWLFDNDGKIAGESGKRVYLFFQLFAALHAYGYTKSDVSSNKKSVVGSCYNENARIPAAQKAKWKDCIVRDLDMAMQGFEPWQFKMATYDPDVTPAAKTQYPEMPESMKTPETPKTSGEYLEPEELPTGVDREEFDPEVWDKMPTPEPLYDPELRLLFGFKT